MSTTLEAGSELEAAEAAAALEAEEAAALEAAQLAARAEELEAAAASGKFEESAGITAEAEAGAASGDALNAPKTTRKRRKKEDKPAQGNLDGGWETLIGGNKASESKIQVVGGAIQPSNPPKHLRKGSTHRIVMDVIVTGYSVDDTLDSDTLDVANTKEKRKLRITGATFLSPEEYITGGDLEPGDDDPAAGDDSETDQ